MKAPRPTWLVLGALSLGGVFVFHNARTANAGSPVNDAPVDTMAKDGGGWVQLGGKDGGGGWVQLGGKDGGGGWVQLAGKDGGSIELAKEDGK
jgi:hypothetical protein